MHILDFQNFYLVGVKGVAMTALAQCLIDAGKHVRGCDVEDQFVTEKILTQLQVAIDSGFTHSLPEGVDCVIFTAAHNGSSNPVVLSAHQQQIPTLTHAEALADICNQKQGVVVSGVGGKSTTSAMIAWILDKTGNQPSFAVGVGNIPGLEKTGQWHPDSQVFVAEADEYATDPAAIASGSELVPRFAFFKPSITVCTNLKFDHPDVYRDFAHTQQVFGDFFTQLKPQGVLVVNGDDRTLLELAAQTQAQRPDIVVETYGENESSSLQISAYKSQDGVTTATLKHRGATAQLALRIPGKYNIQNAAAAVLVSLKLGLTLELACQALATFNSTQRRAEFIGEKRGVLYYDDYAHHPSEIQQVIHAFRDWYPHRKLVVAFQAHTLSRTKALFELFGSAFAAADEVAMLDIFTSAREVDDKSITSDDLCAEIKKQAPHVQAVNYHTLPRLAEYLASEIEPESVVLTLGAGDIYKVHDLIR